MHPEVDEEQAYFDYALDLRDRLDANIHQSERGPDRATARDLRRRVGALGVVDPGVAVAFGRIDAGDQSWYIGKGAIWDEDNELVVVNWQAPVAAPFYQASPEDPEGLDARRIFRCEASNRIRDIEEQVFSGLERAIVTGVAPGSRTGRPSAPLPVESHRGDTRRSESQVPARRSERGGVARRPASARPSAPLAPETPAGGFVFGAGAAGTPYADPDPTPAPLHSHSRTVEVVRSTGAVEIVRDSGTVEVVRLTESTTSTHAAGPASSPYGGTAAMDVPSVAAADDGYDLPQRQDRPRRPDRYEPPARPPRGVPPRRPARSEAGRYDDGPAYPERPQRPARPSRPVQGERAERLGRRARPARRYEPSEEPEEFDGQEPTEGLDRPDRPDRPRRVEHPGRPVRPERADRSERPERSARPERPERADRPEHAVRTAPGVAAAPTAPTHVPAEPSAPVRIQSSDALLDALERARSGELSDIVATIQSAQYDVITRNVDQLLVVQGGPGTGKTVVGLHRVSWMLYNRRGSWQPNDVLVVGPNEAFVRYISAVLPSLGDEAVVQLPVSGLGPRAEVTASDPLELRHLKGDRRMQRLLLRALRNRQKPQRGAVELNVAGRTVRMDGDRVVEQARNLAGQPHNEARRGLRAFLIDEVQTFFRRRGLRGVAAIGDMADGDSTRGIDDYLERIWPAVTPQKFLVDLFSNRRRLEAAGVGLLTEDEIAMLSLPADSRVEEATWSLDDIPLLDLADSLLNGTPVTYEHIVVDEAQDLTPMQFESIRRRSRTGGMTILGDLAQGTSPWSPDSWEEAVLHLRHDRVPTEIAELTIGYRLPAEVHEVAMRLLPEIAPRLRAPEPVRYTGHQVEVAHCHPDELMAGVVDAVDHVIDAGLVGVIVSEREREAVAETLERAGFDWGMDLCPDGATVVVMTAPEAQGLEFDSVVVVEPADIAGECDRGLRALFVALTRTTGSLVLVHSEPLPAALEVDDLPALLPGGSSSAEASSVVTPAASAAVAASPAATGPDTHHAEVEVDGGAAVPSSAQPAALGETFAAPSYAGSLAPSGDVAEGNAMERAMARAIAGEVAEALSRYVTPALAPLVLEEMRQALSARFPGQPELEAGAGSSTAALPAGSAGASPAEGGSVPGERASTEDQVLDIRNGSHHG